MGVARLGRFATTTFRHAAKLLRGLPIRTHLLGWLGEIPIPIPDDVQFCQGCIGDGAPFGLELEPSRPPDLAGHANARPSTEVRNGSRAVKLRVSIFSPNYPR